MTDEKIIINFPNTGISLFKKSISSNVIDYSNTPFNLIKECSSPKKEYDSLPIIIEMTPKLKKHRLPMVLKPEIQKEMHSPD